MAHKDEVAALRKRNEELEERIEKLEAKSKPSEPEKPFVSPPYEPIDWTARMSMPPSALRAMVEAVPDSVMRGVIADRHAPTSPGGAIPASGQASAGGGPANAPGGGSGWISPARLSPPPGIGWVDAQLIADEVRQRAELKRKLGGS